MMKSPQKSLNDGVLELSGWWTHSCASRWYTPTPWGQKLLHLGLSQTSSYVSLHLAVHLHPLSYPVLYNKLVNVSVSLSSVTCSSKLSNLRVGLWQLWCTANWSEVPGTIWDFPLASGVGAVLWAWAFNLWDGMLTSGKQCQNWPEL